MEELAHIYEGKNFKSPEEELDYLRKVIAQKEAHVVRQKTEEAQSLRPEISAEIVSGAYAESTDREKLIEDEIKHYSKHDAERVLNESFRTPAPQEEVQGEVTLPLSPEMHDKNMEGFISRIYTEGILNTIHAVQKMQNPHLTDDFHRFLVQYVKKGLPTPGLKETTPEAHALRKTLFEVILPEKSIQEGGREKGLKEIISSMEQFYAGMLSISGASGMNNNSQDQFAIELAVSEGSDEFVFYVSVPDINKNLFEKQFLAIFPDAKIVEQKDDYNIFNVDGMAQGSVASLARNDIYPIKTYDKFDFDPLNVILNTLSQLKRNGEAAAIQFVFNPVGDYYVKEYKKALDEIRKGTKLKEAIDIRHSALGRFSKAFGEVGKGFIKELSHANKSKEEKKDKKEDHVVDQIALEQITEKISSPIIEINLRIVASAENRQRTMQIITDIESSFNQFENALGNSFKFNHLEGSALQSLLQNFSYRMFDRNSAVPISIKELNTVMHFAGESVSAQPQLRQSRAKSAPAPMGLSEGGLELGLNKHRNSEVLVHLAREDRLRHFYAIGQTGTGKSTLLRKMIIQDIKNGDGVCFIDPHGSDVMDILSHIPRERFDDVIYFDPSQTDRPMALNMLEYNRDFPEQKTFVVNELFSIFQKLYGGNPESMGPMFEQYFRNATMLVIEDPDSGSTLLDVSRVMADAKFRELKLSRCKNPVVVQFWKEIAGKAGGEASLQNMVPYITSKFDVFLANDIMRPIIAQEKSSFNFREIMDGKKILLVNLAKGRLGDINSSLIGLILVGKILMAALSRVDSFGKEMPPFYLYIDEFQNITTPSIATILSEARKYKLSLTMAHQFIAQLDDNIRDAVFGNVGSMAVFRVGSEDAEFLQKQFTPVFEAHDIMNIDNMNCYIKMLSGGRPVKPFNIEFTWPEAGDQRIVEALKELSYLKYGSDREKVERDIMKKYQKEIPAAVASTSSPAIALSAMAKPPVLGANTMSSPVPPTVPSPAPLSVPPPVQIPPIE